MIALADARRPSCSEHPVSIFNFAMVLQDRASGEIEATWPVVLAAFLPVFALSLGILAYCIWRHRHGTKTKHPDSQQLDDLMSRVEKNTKDLHNLSLSLQPSLDRGQRAGHDASLASNGLSFCSTHTDTPDSWI